MRLPESAPDKILPHAAGNFRQMARHGIVKHSPEPSPIELSPKKRKIDRKICTFFGAEIAVNP